MNFALTEFSEVLALRCSAILRDEVVYRRIQHKLYSARMFDATWWRTTIRIPLLSGIATTGISHQVGRRRRVVARPSSCLFTRVRGSRIANFALTEFSE